jgi:hypothetical protein
VRPEDGRLTPETCREFKTLQSDCESEILLSWLRYCGQQNVRFTKVLIIQFLLNSCYPFPDISLAPYSQTAVTLCSRSDTGDKCSHPHKKDKKLKTVCCHINILR